MQGVGPAVFSQSLSPKVGKVEAVTEQQDLLLRETKRGAHRAPAAAVDSLFLLQHGGGSLTMDYLLLENLDYAYFHSCWISSPLLPQGKVLGFNLQPLRSTEREQYLPFKAFLEKPFILDIDREDFSSPL